MKLNRFFPLPCDPFISHMRIAYEDGLRKQTEEYWRTTIVNEILQRIEDMPKEDGGYCHVVHHCEVVEQILLCKGNRNER